RGGRAGAGATRGARRGDQPAEGDRQPRRGSGGTGRGCEGGHSGREGGHMSRMSRMSRRASGTTSTGWLARLLNLVPYLLARPGIRIADAAADLGVSEQQLRDDLELLWVCG